MAKLSHRQAMDLWAVATETHGSLLNPFRLLGDLPPLVASNTTNPPDLHAMAQFLRDWADAIEVPE